MGVKGPPPSESVRDRLVMAGYAVVTEDATQWRGGWCADGGEVVCANARGARDEIQYVSFNEVESWMRKIWKRDLMCSASGTMSWIAEAEDDDEDGSVRARRFRMLKVDGPRDLGCR